MEALSWMAADYPAEWHEKRLERLSKETSRVDLTFDGDFVDNVWNAVKMEPESSKITRADAFMGYLVACMQDIMDEPVKYVHCFAAVSSTIPTISADPLPMTPSYKCALTEVDL